jgi:hypothetical protein
MSKHNVAKSTKRAKTAKFVCVPKRLCLDPAIAHRGQAEGANVTQFEFGILTAVLVAARNQWREQRHRVNFQAGGDDIALDKDLSKQFKEDWRRTKKARRRGEAAEAPQRFHPWRIESPTHKPMKDSKAHPKAGRKGYQRSKQNESSLAPELIKVTLSRFALLRCGKLPTNGGNLAKIDASLDRLTKPVGDSKEPPFEPLLASWCETKSGKLQLTVHGEWLDGPYHRLPLPLPLRGTTTLALLLLLRGIPLHRSDSMTLNNLCERLGIPAFRPANDQRKVNTALALVNAWLETLGVELRQALEQLQRPLRLPASYEIEELADGSIRFSAEPYNIPDSNDDDANTDMPSEDEPQQPAPIRRRRFTPAPRARLLHEPAAMQRDEDTLLTDEDGERVDED